MKIEIGENGLNTDVQGGGPGTGSSLENGLNTDDQGGGPGTGDS